MEFWLKRGVDGFRVDTVNMYSKGDMRDAPITDPGSEWQFAGYQYCNGPRMDEFLGEMNQILEKYGAMTVGECPNTLDMERVHQYVSAKEKRLSMVFQFVCSMQILFFYTILICSIGRCRRGTRPLQIPNDAQKLHSPTVQTRYCPHTGPRSTPVGRLDYRLP